MVQYRSAEVSSSQHYTVNGRGVQCVTYVSKDSQGHRTYDRPHDRLCDALEKMKANAGYNESRMEKLQNEYLCTKGYSYGRGDHDPRPAPQCYSHVHTEFKPLFQGAVHAVQRLSDTIDTGRYHTSEVRHLAEQAAGTVQRVKDFTYDHPEMNYAFEKALYDTNAAGVGGLLAMLIPPLGMLAFAGNAMMNNEFDGKIGRAYQDAQDVMTHLATVEVELGYY
jgi:hypothetical protein